VRRIKFKLILYDIKFHSSRLSALGLFACKDIFSRFVLSDIMNVITLLDPGTGSPAHGPSQINRSASCPAPVCVLSVRCEPAIMETCDVFRKGFGSCWKSYQTYSRHQFRDRR
jgi:hypothetical protein